MSHTGNPPIDQQTSIDALVLELSSKDISRRKEARKTLALIGIPAIKPLGNVLAADHREARIEAIRTLVSMFRPETAPYLVGALENEDPEVRWLATEGLIALGRKGLEPLLKALIAKPETLWLRLGAHHVIFDLYIGEVHEEERRFLPLYGLNSASREALRPLLIALESMDHAVLVPSAANKALKVLAVNP